MSIGSLGKWWVSIGSVLYRTKEFGALRCRGIMGEGRSSGREKRRGKESEGKSEGGEEK